MLLFPLFLLIIQLSFNQIFARLTNSSGITLRHSRRPAPKVYDVELVLKQAQNDDFDEAPSHSPSKSSVIYPSSAIIPEDEGDGIDPLDDGEDDGVDGEDKEIKRMPSRFYRRRYGNRYMRPFIGGGGSGMPPMGGGMPSMGSNGGMAPFGYGMRRPNGMALGGMNINGMGGMSNMGPMGSGMAGGMGPMGSSMGSGNDGMSGGGGGMGPDGSDGSDDAAYPMRFNYRRPFPMVPSPDGMRGNGINGYGTSSSYGPSNNGNNNWFNNNNYGDGFINGGYGGYGFLRGGGGNSMMGGGGMGPSSGGYGPSSSGGGCGPMGCGNGGGGNMMGSNMGSGQSMMRPNGPGGFYMGGYSGGPMMGKGGMGMGMGGGWNGPMGANLGGGGGGDDGDGGMGDGNGMMGGGGMNGDGPPTGAVGIHMSNNGYSYAAYIERQVRSTTIMMYTLVGCAPCQRAKHLLAVHYADVKSHFLELVGDEDWQRQLQVDLQHVTGAMTFPYIFVCGNYVGGSTDLIALHQSGQLRRMVNSCSRKTVAAAAVAVAATV